MLVFTNGIHAWPIGFAVEDYKAKAGLSMNLKQLPHDPVHSV